MVLRKVLPDGWTDRKQQVYLDGELSETLDVSIGVFWDLSSTAYL